MAKIFITGSSDGLGFLAAQELLSKKHEVVVHARNNTRADDIRSRFPGTEILIGDLSDIDEVKALADSANKLAPFDAVIHNAGVYQASSKDLFTVNTLAPYLLTSLIAKPQRLIYLSSDMHMHGRFNPDSFKPDKYDVSYGDTKLHVLMLAKAVARKHKTIYSNAVNPGWVPTKMGGKGAPDNLQKGVETQVWLAISNDEKAKVSGEYFYHKKIASSNTLAHDESLQDSLIGICSEITGVRFT